MVGHIVKPDTSSLRILLISSTVHYHEMLSLPVVARAPSKLAGLSGIRGAVDEEEATALSNAELRFWVVAEEDGPDKAEPLPVADPFSSQGLGRGGIDEAMMQ
jgi:hypothetical protein